MQELRQKNALHPQTIRADMRVLSTFPSIEPCSLLSSRYQEELPIFFETYHRALDNDIRELTKSESLQKFTVPKFCDIEEGFERLLGPDWPGHALRHEPLFWHREPYEADITKLIVRILWSDLKSIQAFLYALYEICKTNADFDIKNFEHITEPIRVAAEERTEQDGRIDILFEWGKNEDARVIVIEAKFDAVANNPFDIYHKKACELLKARGGNNEVKNILHVFLIQDYSSECYMTNTDSVAENISHDFDKSLWKIAYWQDLLPKWEHRLQSTFSHSLPHASTASVRRSIFQKVYGAKNGR